VSTRCHERARVIALRDTEEVWVGLRGAGTRPKSKSKRWRPEFTI
jgi:hypothetical protein